jgi:hypothetical protein
MPEEFQRILLDQNIPQALSEWLQKKCPVGKSKYV